MTQRFPIRITRGPGRLFVRIFGARPGMAWVDVGDDHFEAVFGFARVETTLANIGGWRIEGPWSPFTALGVRRSVRHADITFGGSAHGGVRIDFRQPVRVGPFRTPALYVSADDLLGLASGLEQRGIPGVDARRGISPPTANG